MRYKSAPKLKNNLEGPGDLSSGFVGPNQQPTNTGIVGYHPNWAHEGDDFGRYSGGYGSFGKRYFKGHGNALLGALLDSEGKTDPGRLNLELSDIDRSTQTGQIGIGGQAAAGGLENSGLVAALKQANAQGGSELRSRAIARDNAIAEQRKRDDLKMLLNILEAKKGRANQLKLGRITGRQQAGGAFDFGGALSGIGDILKLFKVGGGGDPDQADAFGGSAGGYGGGVGGDAQF